MIYLQGVRLRAQMLHALPGSALTEETFTFRAFSRRLYPKLLTISPFNKHKYRRRRKKISLSIQ